MRIAKYTLLTLGGLLIVGVLVLVYVAATLDLNRYKPQIVKAVHDRTQRTLRLDGDISFSLWPAIGAKVAKASLSERGSDQTFAAVEEAHVSLKLIPLLSRQVVADTVTLTGLRASIVRRKDGTTNVDDLAGAPADAPKKTPAPAEGEPLQFDIAGVDIRNATLQYAHLAAGTKYELSNLDLRTGRLAPGVPTRVELSVRAQATEPSMDLRTVLKTRLAVEPGQAVKLDDLEFDAKGAAAGITDLALRARGSAMAHPAKGDYSAKRLNVTLTGLHGKEKLEVRADIPSLQIAADRASGEKVAIVVRLAGPEGVTQANLTLPGIEGTAQSFRSAAAQVALEMKRGDLSLQANADSPLTGNAQARQLSLPKLRARITATGPHLPGKRVTGELAGSAGVDLAKQRGQANLAGKVGDSQLKSQVTIAAFAPLSVSFNVDVDQLNVDQYLPPQQAAGQGAGKGAGKGAPQPREEPFDLSALRDLRADGKLRIAALTARNVKASDVRVDVKANAGRLELSPLAAGLYQGQLAGSIAVDAAPATPTFAIRQKLTGVNIGPLLRDLADNDTLEGRGTVSLDVTAQGATVSALKKGLNGNAAVNLADGAIKGIDIAGALRNAKARLGALRGEHSQEADKTQRTDFSELSATFAIKNGVARSSDLSMKSPLLRAGGEGAINLGEDTVDYLLKASIVGTIKGQGGRDLDELRGVTVPVRVAGPLTAPSYRLDFSSMVTDTAKQRLTDELQKRLGVGTQKGEGDKKEAEAKGETRPRDVLRGILGR